MFFVIALVGLYVFMSNAKKPRDVLQPKEMLVATRTLPLLLRKAPEDAADNVIGRIPKGTRIKVYECVPAWCKVVDSHGTRGWVESRYLK